ncbi:MAG TPA: hypothetical protein VL418_08105 [Devosiaceae bacterium]|jgi:hypothetical protein|nr:hypothetical protein [Devosiaceae bacterium]
MNVTQTLIRHRDIQDWVTARHGMPAITRIPTTSGQIRARLALAFGGPSRRPDAPPGAEDDGMSPVSWRAWLAELDRQHLALKVTGERGPAFEFVERKDSGDRNSELN